MLPCINCKKPVEEGRAKLFAEVFVCADCYRVAELLYRRGENELYQYLALLKEMIRTSLISGSLQLKMQEGEGPVVSIAEAIKRGGGIPKGCKKEGMQPHVRTLAALGGLASKQQHQRGTG